VLLFEGLAEEDLARVPAKAARVRDEPHQVVAGILRLRDRARVLPRRWPPDRRRRPVGERLIVVVLAAPLVPDDETRRAGMLPRVAPALALDQAASPQQVARCARRGELESRASLREPRQQLPGSPAPASFTEPRDSFCLVAIEPLVPRLPADPIARAELAHAVVASFPVHHEVHLGKFRPGHSALRSTSVVFGIATWALRSAVGCGPGS
jgi:hypothetical protein